MSNAQKFNLTKYTHKTMKPIQRILTTFFAAISLITFCINANAGGHDNWKLITDESAISFVSIKKGSIAEAHTFTDFSGVLDHGKASVTIKADSVDTMVPIRNERAREFLFETGVYPTISIKSDVTEVMKSAETGSTALLEVPATLSLHGVEKDISLNVSLSHNSKTTLVVASTKPVIIKAADYGMEEGVLKLAELVGGIPIANAVPINFVLTFKKQ